MAMYLGPQGGQYVYLDAEAGRKKRYVSQMAETQKAKLKLPPQQTSDHVERHKSMFGKQSTHTHVNFRQYLRDPHLSTPKPRANNSLKQNFGHMAPGDAHIESVRITENGWLRDKVTTRTKNGETVNVDYKSAAKRNGKTVGKDGLRNGGEAVLDDAINFLGSSERNWRLNQLGHDAKKKFLTGKYALKMSREVGEGLVDAIPGGKPARVALESFKDIKHAVEIKHFLDAVDPVLNVVGTAGLTALTGLPIGVKSTLTHPTHTQGKDWIAETNGVGVDVGLGKLTAGVGVRYENLQIESHNVVYDEAGHIMTTTTKDQYQTLNAGLAFRDSLEASVGAGVLHRTVTSDAVEKGQGTTNLSVQTFESTTAQGTVKGSAVHIDQTTLSDVSVHTTSKTDSAVEVAQFRVSDRRYVASKTVANLGSEETITKETVDGTPLRRQIDSSYAQFKSADGKIDASQAYLSQRDTMLTQEARKTDAVGNVVTSKVEMGRYQEQNHFSYRDAAKELAAAGNYKESGDYVSNSMGGSSSKGQYEANIAASKASKDSVVNLSLEQTGTVSSGNGKRSSTVTHSELKMEEHAKDRAKGISNQEHRVDTSFANGSVKGKIHAIETKTTTDRFLHQTTGKVGSYSKLEAAGTYKHFSATSFETANGASATTVLREERGVFTENAASSSTSSTALDCARAISHDKFNSKAVPVNTGKYIGELMSSAHKVSMPAAASHTSTEKGKFEQVNQIDGHLPHGTFHKTEASAGIVKRTFVNDKISYFEEQSQYAGRETRSEHVEKKSRDGSSSYHREEQIETHGQRHRYMDKSGNVRKNELEHRDVNTHETRASSSSSFLGLVKESSTNTANAHSSSTVQRTGIIDQIGTTLAPNAVAISQQSGGSTCVLQSKSTSVEYTTEASSNLLYNKLESSVKQTVDQNVVSEQRSVKYAPSVHVQAAGMSIANDLATNLLTSDRITVNDIAKHAAQAAGQSVATQVITENIQKAIPTGAVGNAVIGTVVSAAFDLQHGKATVAAQHALENLAGQAISAVADTSIPLTVSSSHTIANRALFGKSEYHSDVQRENLDASFYGMKGGIHFEKSETTYTTRDGTVMHRKEAGLGAHGNLLNTGVSLGLHNVFEKAETRTYHENGEIIQKDYEASKQGQFVGRVTFGDKEQLLKGPAFNSKETTTLTKKREDGEAYSIIDGLPYKYLRTEAAAAGIADANGVILPSSKSNTPGVSGPASEAVAAARATVNVGHHQIVAGIGDSFKNGVSEKVYSRVEQTTKEKQGYGVISTTNDNRKMDIVTLVEKAFTSSEFVVGDEFRTTFQGDVSELQRTDLREETVSKRKLLFFKKSETHRYGPGERVLNVQEVDHLHLETSISSKADGSAFYESETTSTSESTGEITQRTEKGMTRIDATETSTRSKITTSTSSMVGEYEEQRTSERDYEIGDAAAGKVQTVHEKKIQTEAGTFEDLISTQTIQNNELINSVTHKPGENRLVQTEQLTSTYTQSMERNKDETKFHTDMLGTKTIEGVTGEVSVDVFAKQNDDVVYDNHVSGDKGHSWSKASLGAFHVKEMKNVDNGAQTFGTLAVTEQVATENLVMGSASYVTETGTVTTGKEPENEVASFQAGEKDLDLTAKVTGSIVDTTWSAKNGDYFSKITLTGNDGAEITEVVNQVTDRRQEWNEKTQDDGSKQTSSAERFESGTKISTYVGAVNTNMDLAGLEISYTAVTKQEYKSFVDKSTILSGEQAGAMLGDKSCVAEELYLTQVTTDKRSCGLFTNVITETVDTTKAAIPTTENPAQSSTAQPEESNTLTTAITQFSQGSSRAIAATGGCLVNLAIKRLVHGKALDEYDAGNACLSIGDSFSCGTLTEVAAAAAKLSGGKAVAGIAVIAGAISAGCSYLKKRNLKKQAKLASKKEKKKKKNKKKKVTSTREKIATVGDIVSDMLPTVVQVGLSAAQYGGMASGICTAAAVGLGAAKSAGHYYLGTKNPDGSLKVDNMKLAEDLTTGVVGAGASIGTAVAVTAALPTALTTAAATSLLASAATVVLPAAVAALVAGLTALAVGKLFGWVRKRRELASLCAEIGLSSKCTEEDLRQQLKGMWLRHHPDKGGNSETFIQQSKKFERIYALRKELGYANNSNFVTLVVGLVGYAYSNVTGAFTHLFDNAIVEEGQPAHVNGGIKSYQRLTMLIGALEEEKFD